MLILLGILNGRFKGDAQNDIESWERDIRSFEKQTSFAIPDFVKAGILISGLQEEPLRRPMVLHTSRLDTHEKLRLEVTEIARAKVMSANSVPMDVGALRFNGKGKGKSKDHKEKGKANKEKGTQSDCLRRKADLEKAKSEGRPAVPPQAVHAVHEVGYSSSTVDEVRSAGGSAGVSVIRTTQGEVAYIIWVLSAASIRNKHHPKGIMLDSSAAVSVCPVDCFPEHGIQQGRRIELQEADGSPVEHCGSKDVFYMVGSEAMKVRFEVTSVKAQILSLAAPAGDLDTRVIFLYSVVVISPCRWTGSTLSAGSSAWRCGGRAKRDLVADRVCGLKEIELERQQVRRPELLPEEHPVHARSKPLPKEPSIEERRAHELTHLPARSCVRDLREVFWLGGSSPSSARRVVTCLNYRSTFCSWDAAARRS